MNDFEQPTHIYSGLINGGHVQGIATDGKYMYFSFTTLLLKTDLSGRPVGSVTGITGHLGCIAMYGGVVIGSLEYKNDAIGKGILSSIGSRSVNTDAFYIACFDVEKINAMNMDALSDRIMTVVSLKDVLEDYTYKDETVTHRYGCSGIDGITVVPDFNGKPTIFVAYGIYGDITRTDNDNQVILAFDAERVILSLKPQKPGVGADSEGIRCDRKLFVYTGNTNYGIQNIEYDSYTGYIFAAVYPGKKPEFPNYKMYYIDIKKQAQRNGRSYLALADVGERHSSGIYGSNFPYGSTGIISLNNGYYYFSEPGTAQTGEHYSDVWLYRIVNDGNFEKIR